MARTPSKHLPLSAKFLSGSSLKTLSNSANATSPLGTPRSISSISTPSIGNDSILSGSTTKSGMLTPDLPTQESTSTSGTISVATNSADSGHSSYVCIGNETSAAASLCCDNGRCVMKDPLPAQTVCSNECDPARFTLGGYTCLQSASVGVYGTPFTANEQFPYSSISGDNTHFYTSLSNPYAFKETNISSDMASWSSAGLQPSASFYSYDPTFGAYGYGAATYDLAARRSKNTTRESTATLKVWLNEHKKNPYPTKGEKIMLAIITKMTLTQVSTWFANARRRLKKENKMTWEPKNRTDDDDDADDDNDAALASDEEREKDRGNNSETKTRHGFGASAVSGGGGGSSLAACADVTAVVTTASVAGVGGFICNHRALTGTDTDTDLDAARATDVGVGAISSAQPKVPYQLENLQQQQQQQSAQYNQFLYYNSNSYHQQYQQLHQQKSAMSALTQHVANNTFLHQQQHLQTNRLDRQ